MVKRLLRVLAVCAAMLALALTFAAPALADPPDLPQGEETRNNTTVAEVTVGGQLVELKAGTPAQGAGYSFDGDRTLTLNGYNAGSILCFGEITIALEGSNYLTPTLDAQNGGPTPATNKAHEYIGLFGRNYSMPGWYEESLITLTGSGSLTISANSQADSSFFGVRACRLAVAGGSQLYINLPATVDSYGIHLNNSDYGIPWQLYNYAEDYSGQGWLTVDTAALGVKAGQPIVAYDIRFKYSYVNVESLLGQIAVMVSYDKGSLTLEDIHGATVQSYDTDYSFTDPEGKTTNYRITKKYLVVTSLSGGADVISMVPGEGTDHPAGWAYEGGYWYFYEPDGSPFTDGWLSVDGKWYNFDSDGHLRLSTWIKDWGGLAYVDASGVAFAGTGWQKFGSDYYYFESLGYNQWSVAYASRWLNYSGTYYYFGADGKLALNTTVDYEGTRYYIGADGKVYKSEKITGAQGVSGTCSWTIDAAGTLTIYPTNGTSGVLVPNYQLDSFWGPDTTFSWYPYAYMIKAAVIKDGVGATSLEGLFYGCSDLTSVDFAGLDSSQATSMEAMFWGCGDLSSLDLSGFNTSQVSNMYGMFEGCASLAALDLSAFDTSRVTDMTLMFGDCGALAAIDMSGWNTAQVTSMQSMFAGTAVASLDLSSFDTRNATSMGWLFDGCRSLRTLIIGANFVQPTTDDDWCAPSGTWRSAADGKSYTGYELAHKQGPDTFTRTDTPHEPGWFKDNGVWHYYDYNGELVRNGWAYTDDGTMYYMDENGAVATNRLIEMFEGYNIYVGADGKRASGWVKAGNTYYYCDSDGMAYCEMWLKYKGAYYYFGSDCKIYVSRWLEWGGGYYYFGADGKLAVDTWVSYNGTYYYLGSDGRLVRNGWAKYQGKYYFLQNYVPVKNTYLTIDGVKYWFNASGVASRA